MDIELIYQLLKVKGAINYSSDASMQVLLPTEDGKYLRVGVTDDDVAEVKGIWFDYYEGLNGEIDKLKPIIISQTIEEYCHNCDNPEQFIDENLVKNCKHPFCQEPNNKQCSVYTNKTVRITKELINN